MLFAPTGTMAAAKLGPQDASPATAGASGNGATPASNGSGFTGPSSDEFDSRSAVSSAPTAADPATNGASARAADGAGAAAARNGASADLAADGVSARDGGGGGGDAKAALVDMRRAAYLGEQTARRVQPREQCAPLHIIAPELSRRSAEPAVRPRLADVLQAHHNLHAVWLCHLMCVEAGGVPFWHEHGCRCKDAAYWCMAWQMLGCSMHRMRASSPIADLVYQDTGAVAPMRLWRMMLLRLAGATCTSMSPETCSLCMRAGRYSSMHARAWTTVVASLQSE